MITINREAEIKEKEVENEGVFQLEQRKFPQALKLSF